MGTSTNGIICFGLSFDEDFEFPWSKEDDDGCCGEIEDFWLEKIVGKEYVDYSYEQKQLVLKNNPIPAEVVTHCSYDYPMYILAVPGTELSCCRGFPTDFDPSRLKVTDKQVEDLIKFCKDNKIKIPGKPKWYLVSMWG